MRKILVTAILCVAAQSVFAANQPGQLTFSVILSDDKGAVISRDVVATRNNYPAQVNRTQQASFPSCQRLQNGRMDCSYTDITTGLYLSATPEIQPDGRISTQLEVLYSVLDSTQKLIYDGIEVELPQVITSSLKQRITLNQNKELEIPFGLVINGSNLYTLKIAAMIGQEQPATAKAQKPSPQGNPLLNILLDAVK